MKELFEKIYIKTASDLPKEGRYFTHLKDGYEYALNFNPTEDLTKFGCEYQAHPEYWLESIDWYLQPIEPLPAPVSDEMIEKYFTSSHFDDKNGHHYRINKDRIFGAKAMRDGKIK